MNRTSVTFRIQFLLTALALIFFGACKTSFDDIKYNSGNADFTRYIAIGGGYTAGYADNALYRDAQLESYPQIMASRFALVSGLSFNQPLVNNGVGIGVLGNARFQLKLVPDICGSSSLLSAQPVDSTGDISNFTWLGNTTRYHNLGVPGLRAKDLTSQTFGDPSPFLGNPFYSRFASNPGTSTITGDGLLVSPTFYSIWVGMDDIYGYARKGGDESGDSITSLQVFKEGITNLLSDLSGNDANGIIATLPVPSSIPFFTTIPYNGLTLDAAKATQLTTAYALINPAITFSEGANRFVIADNSEPSGRRQIEDGEYILLSIPQDSIRCSGWGSLTPIPSKYVLNSDEVTAVNNAISAYNSAIRTIAETNGVAVAEMQTLFSTLTRGITFNGVNYSSEYASGGAFSTDGFYPSSRGYAIIANEFIRTINSYFSAKLPQVDVNSYPGIKFP